MSAPCRDRLCACLRGRLRAITAIRLTTVADARARVASVAYSGPFQYTYALNPCVTGDRVPE
ncbi:hypothetical protein PT2222_270144 [Paraburkholderia tropica]